MSTTQKPLAFNTLSTTGITEIFNNSAPAQVHPFLVLTNRSAEIVEVTVYVNSGVGDLEIAKRKLPAGVGKNWRVLELSDTRLASNYTISLELDVAESINYFLSGIEISND